MLAIVGVVGAANGFFVGLGLFSVLALALETAERAPPPSLAGPLSGAGVAIVVVLVATLRERTLAEREVPSWVLDAPLGEPERKWERQVAKLAELSDLAAVPRLRFVEGEAPNAFALGDADGEGASIMVTAGALVLLTPRELLAILAQQVAHIETGDLRVVALADSVQSTVADLGSLKGRYLWGPRRILRRLLPVTAVMLLLALMPLLASRPGLETPVAIVAFLVALVLYVGWEEWGWSAPLKRFGKRSAMALLQFAIWMSLFTSVTLVEALLAWPTIFALSRILSRSRVFAADRRAVKLTDDPGGLRRALEATASVESEVAGRPFDRLRFSLFVTPRAASGYRAWVERVTGTHPSTERRIGRLPTAPAQARFRALGRKGHPEQSLEQSG